MVHVAVHARSELPKAASIGYNQLCERRGLVACGLHCLVIHCLSSVANSSFHGITWCASAHASSYQLVGVLWMAI